MIEEVHPKVFLEEAEELAKEAGYGSAAELYTIIDRGDYSFSFLETQMLNLRMMYRMSVSQCKHPDHAPWHKAWSFVGTMIYSCPACGHQTVMTQGPKVSL